MCCGIKKERISPVEACESSVLLSFKHNFFTVFILLGRCMYPIDKQAISTQFERTVFKLTHVLTLIRVFISRNVRFYSNPLLCTENNLLCFILES